MQKKTCKAPRFDVLGGLFAKNKNKNKINLMHLSIAHVCFTALDLGAAVCKQAGSRRLRTDSWPRAASPLRGSRWVSGNWALKSGPACMECPLGPGRAPAPGELARADRLHSSTGRPDSRATLQTSLGPRLEAKTARRRGARPVPDSQTCRFYDSPWQSRHQRNCWLLRDLGSARPSARAGFGFSAAGLALERRPFLLWPRKLQFRAHWEPGGPGDWAFRDSLRGPRNDVRGRHIFSGSRLRREGAYSFWGPGDSAAPPQERPEGFSPGKFARRGRRGGGGTERARRLFPQGHAGCSASPGRPGPGGGPRASVRGCAPGSPRSLSG